MTDPKQRRRLVFICQTLGTHQSFKWSQCTWAECSGWCVYALPIFFSHRAGGVHLGRLLVGLTPLKTFCWCRVIRPEARQQDSAPDAPQQENAGASAERRLKRRKVRLRLHAPGRSCVAPASMLMEFLSIFCILGLLVSPFCPSGHPALGQCLCRESSTELLFTCLSSDVALIKTLGRPCPKRSSSSSARKTHTIQQQQRSMGRVVMQVLGEGRRWPMGQAVEAALPAVHRDHERMQRASKAGAGLPAARRQLHELTEVRLQLPGAGRLHDQQQDSVTAGTVLQLCLM